MLWFSSHKRQISLPSIDLHNHLLPGVDDGFQEVTQSLEAIKLLANVGVKNIVFTPHMNPDVFPKNTEKVIRASYQRFREQIPADLGITTSLAAEYMIVHNFENRATNPELLLHGDNSILIEMSYYFRSQNLEQTIFELNMAGKHPILAHPERYIYMAEKLEDFEKLQDMGCLFQMNWMSLTGAYGKASLKILQYLLSHDMYSFIATDLHTIHHLHNILSIHLSHSMSTAIERLIEKEQKEIKKMNYHFE